MNTVTSETEFSAPPEFRGGILADDMGLGKTLTAIALVASDRDTVSGDMPMWNTAAFELKSTLIVVRAPRKPPDNSVITTNYTDYGSSTQYLGIPAKAVISQYPIIRCKSRANL